jgi:hypothetical protein
MTISGDDLPAGGPQQVVCACLATTFDVVLDGGTVKAVCPSGHVAGAWAVDRAVDSGHLVTPERDVPLEYRQPPQAGAAWLDPSEGAMVSAVSTRPPEGTEAEIRKAMGMPPALPQFSPGMCNAWLEGGPYDGQATWIMDAGSGGLDFHVSGVAHYRFSARMKDNGGPSLLAIYAWVPPAGT